MTIELNKNARDRFVQENAAWGRITPEERIAWTKALAQFPPTTLNVIANWALRTAIRNNSPVLFPTWVSVATYWDRLGVTPENWLAFTTHLTDGSRRQGETS